MNADRMVFARGIQICMYRSVDLWIIYLFIYLCSECTIHIDLIVSYVVLFGYLSSYLSYKYIHIYKLYRQI